VQKASIPPLSLLHHTSSPTPGVAVPQSGEKRSPDCANRPGFKKWVAVHPFFWQQMKKDRVRKLLKAAAVAVFLGVMSGLGKGVGLFLIAYFLP
jgi:hypothetical protein